MAGKLAMNFSAAKIIDELEFWDILSFIPKATIDAKLYVVFGDPRGLILRAIRKSVRLATPTMEKISVAIDDALEKVLWDPEVGSALFKFDLNVQPTELSVSLGRLGEQYGRLIEQMRKRRGRGGK